jgi:MFS transporter, DHA1 family, multidrug resistance protein
LWSGVAVGPLIGGVMADAWGFRAPFIVTAVLLLVSGILIRQGVHETFTRVPAAARSRGMLAGWREMLHLPGVGVTYSVRFLAAVGQTLIQPIAPLFISSLLAPGAPVATVTGVVAGLVSASSIGSALYFSRLSERVGAQRVLVVSLLGAVLFFLPQTFVTGIWPFLILQTLTGVALGGITPTLSALLGRFSNAGEEGAVYGLDNSISSGARTLAPMLGASIAVWFDLRAAFAATAAIFLLGTLLASVGLPGRRRSPEVLMSR